MFPTKETLVYILKRLVWYWDLATYFLELIENSSDESFIEDVFQLIKKEIDSIKNEEVKIQMEKHIREKLAYERIENQEHEEADKELDDALNILFT